MRPPHPSPAHGPEGLSPELVYLAVLPFFGDEAAWREFDAAVLMRSGGKGG